MRCIITISFIALVCGCGMTKVKIAGPIDSVGVIINSNTNTLCHDYTGFTAFQNTTNSYVFKNKLSETIKETLLEELKIKGIETILIKSDDIMVDGNILNVSTWNNSQSVKPEIKNKFAQRMHNHKVDAVFIYEMNVGEENEKCEGIAYLDSSIYGLYVSAGAVALLTREGEYSENLNLYAKVSGAPIARQPKRLNEIYIENIKRIIVEQLKNELSKKISLH